MVYRFAHCCDPAEQEALGGSADALHPPSLVLPPMESYFTFRTSISAALERFTWNRNRDVVEARLRGRGVELAKILEAAVANGNRDLSNEAVLEYWQIVPMGIEARTGDRWLSRRPQHPRLDSKIRIQIPT